MDEVISYTEELRMHRPEIHNETVREMYEKGYSLIKNEYKPKTLVHELTFTK